MCLEMGSEESTSVEALLDTQTPEEKARRSERKMTRPLSVQPAAGASLRHSSVGAVPPVPEKVLARPCCRVDLKVNRICSSAE